VDPAPRRPSARRGTTLVEVCVAIAIAVAAAGVILPTVSKLNGLKNRAACASNLRQLGTAFSSYRMGTFGRLPGRPSGLDQTNPHVFKYKNLPDSVAPTMQSLAGSREVFYCPGNYDERTPAGWWPYASGTVAATYQFPFLLKPSLWQVRRYDYDRLKPDAVLAADYLGSDVSPSAPLAWNHERAGDGAPSGMNELFGDGRVEWRSGTGGWVLWGRSGGPMNWYLAK
jgi:hypothetical protein